MHVTFDLKAKILTFFVRKKYTKTHKRIYRFLVEIKLGELVNLKMVNVGVFFTQGRSQLTPSAGATPVPLTFMRATLISKAYVHF